MYHRVDAYRPSELIEPIPAPNVYSGVLGLTAIKADNQAVHDQMNFGQVQYDSARVVEIETNRSEATILQTAQDYSRALVGIRPEVIKQKDFINTVRGRVVETLIRGTGSEQEYERSKHLRNAALYLQELPDDQKNTINKYVANMPPAFLEIQIAAANAVGTNWVDWVSKRYLLNEEAKGIVNTQDEQAEAALLTFLHWHVSVIAEQQSHPANARNLTKQQAVFKNMVEEGVDEGRFSPEALAAVRKAQNVRVHFGDIFDPEIIDGANGYHVSGTVDVVLKQGTGERLAGMFSGERFLDSWERTNSPDVIHELNHAALHTNVPNYSISRDRWHHEAYTQHITAVQISGQPDEVHPSGRRVYDGIYVEERIVAANVLEGPRGNVGVNLATRAYSGTEADKIEYERAVDAAWGGKDLLKKITDYVLSAEAILKQKWPLDDKWTIQRSALHNANLALNRLREKQS